MKREDVLMVLCGALLLLSLSLLFYPAWPGKISGHAVSQTTTSNVSIGKYLAISMSSNLVEGIQFGDVTSLPVDNVNASHNYDGGSSATTMYLTVSSDSNTPVDFCLKANDDLKTSGGDVLDLANETYSNASSTNVSTPALADQTALTTSYVKAQENVAEGTSAYYRFWLDIPVAQPSGVYNNTVSFKGVVTSLSC